MDTAGPRTRRIFFESRSVDVLILGFIALIAALEISFRANLPDPGVRLATIGGLAIGYVLAGIVAARAAQRSLLLASCLRIVMVMASSSVIYAELGHLIHLVFPFTWDALINRIDLAVFGVLPSVWLESFARPWLTEVMMFAYVVYLPLLPAVAWLAYRSAGVDGMERYLFELTFVNFLCYLGYVAVPVAGPSRALALLFSAPLPGHFFTSLTEYMAGNIHLPGGAFPSAHCAASTVLLLTAFRHGRGAGWMLAPVVAMIYLSTVYGRFHYVLDVAGGVLIAVLAAAATPAVMKACDRWVIGIAFARRPGAGILGGVGEREAA